MSPRFAGPALLVLLLAAPLGVAARRVSLHGNLEVADQVAVDFAAADAAEDAEFAGVRLVSVEEATERAAPFEQIVAAAAPISTACSWWNNPGGKSFYKQYGSVCGVQGEGKAAIDAHIERVWGLIKAAHKELSVASASKRTLHIFLAPEWTFRRYPVGGATEIKPLSFSSMHYIIGALIDKLKNAMEDFDNWLIVPGSIYWGVPIPKPPSYAHATSAPKYAVFNTLPIIYEGKLVFAHNKFMQADNLDEANEIWGYDLMKEFPDTTGCREYGEAGRICGADKFVDWLRKHQSVLGEDVAKVVTEWGVKQPADAIVVNGIVVGVDICLDHRMDLGYKARAAERLKSLVHVDKFDLQLLVSSGMSFSIPEEDGALSLILRQNGVALSADGISGPEGSQLFRKEPSTGTESFHDRHGAVKQSANKRGLVRMTLQDDFEEMPASLQGLWGSGCVGTPIEAGCPLCRIGQMRTITSAQNAHTFCSTEAGNWRLLKSWATPIALLPPQPGVQVLLPGGSDGGVAVTR